MVRLDESSGKLLLSRFEKAIRGYGNRGPFMNIMMLLAERAIAHIASRDALESWLILVGVLLFYGTLIAFVRWNVLARTLRDHLLAEIDMVSSRIEAMTGKPPSNWLEKDEGTIEPVPQPGDPQGFSLLSAVSLLRQAKRSLKRDFFDMLFWSRGEEVTSLHCIREADRLLVSAYSLPELKVHLATTAENLLHMEDAEAAVLGRNIQKALGDLMTGEQELRAWLWEGLLFQGDAEIGRVRNSTDLQNRTMWLTSTALLLIAGLGWVGGHPELFLAGAIGGFLGRLMRVLKSKEDVKAFGVSSWGSIFLSPLLGALVGWCGVILSVVTKVGIVSFPQNLDQTWWGSSYSLSALGLAVLLGLSEKYFDRLLAGNEESTPADSGVKPAAVTAGNVTEQLPQRN